MQDGVIPGPVFPTKLKHQNKQTNKQTNQKVPLNAMLDKGIPVDL